MLWFISCSVCAFVGMYFGMALMESRYHTECINAGVAKYEFTTNEKTGEVAKKFVYINNTKKENGK